MAVCRAMVAACCAAGMVTVAMAGPDWIERRDAGSLIGTAQVPERPVGATALTSIAGTLAEGFGGPDYEDLYFIRITDPSTFSLRLAFADFDPAMYLFNVTLNGEGYGLLGNQDESISSTLPKLIDRSNDGTQVIVSFPGDYVLAITTQGRYPVSRTGAMFNFETLTEVSGPDGPGGINPLQDWEGSGQTGGYGIMLTGSDFPRTPAPGVVMTMGMALMGVAGRRRRA